MHKTKMCQKMQLLRILTSLEIAHVSDAISNQFLQQKLLQFSEKSGHDNMDGCIGWRHTCNYSLVCVIVGCSLHSLLSEKISSQQRTFVCLKQPAKVLL